MLGGVSVVFFGLVCLHGNCCQDFTAHKCINPCAVRTVRIGNGLCFLARGWFGLVDPTIGWVAMKQDELQEL